MLIGDMASKLPVHGSGPGRHFWRLVVEPVFSVEQLTLPSPPCLAYADTVRYPILKGWNKRINGPGSAVSSIEG